MQSTRHPHSAVALRRLFLGTLLLGAACFARSSLAAPAWGDYGANPQHTARSANLSQALRQIVWQTPVDLNPQYSGTVLYIHYGTPLVSEANTIIVPVKVGAADSFQVEARSGSNGALLWQYESDYALPAYNWLPSYGPTLAPSGRLYIAGAGGTLLYTDNVDAAGPHAFTRVAFYGIANYNADPAGFNADVRICTPLTSDAQGNVYFGYRATGANPMGLQGGIARVTPIGTGNFVYATAATDTVGLAQQALMNCAPALSNDGLTLYTALRLTSSSKGYLVALNAADLTPKAHVLLRDPHSLLNARLANDGTASPMVAPDDRVYFGVLENPGFSNAARGWLLQFDSNLVSSGVPCAFGWDDTPSLVPSSIVASYQGASPYLLMVKYNFYAGAGGDGVNKIAIVDPNDSQLEPFTGTVVMKEIDTIAGVTPDSDFVTSGYPNAVREWCINTAAVDPYSHSVLAGSEDGVLYRWDLATNTFTQSVRLTPGIGEAYTPTVIARNGLVLAINNATLFAVGAAPGLAVPQGSRVQALALEILGPNPFQDATAIRFALPQAGRATLDVIDAAGRRVSRLVQGNLAAGEHFTRWEGRDANGRRSATGIYFLRLTDGSLTVTRRLALTR